MALVHGQGLGPAEPAVQAEGEVGVAEADSKTGKATEGGARRLRDPELRGKRPFESVARAQISK